MVQIKKKKKRKVVVGKESGKTKTDVSKVNYFL